MTITDILTDKVLVKSVKTAQRSCEPIESHEATSVKANSIRGGYES
jgi:hypothetical protein